MPATLLRFQHAGKRNARVAIDAKRETGGRGGEGKFRRET
jgi:hypothetical protein